jgi:hypothetical protein
MNKKEKKEIRKKNKICEHTKHTRKKRKSNYVSPKKNKQQKVGGRRKKIDQDK